MRIIMLSLLIMCLMIAYYTVSIGMAADDEDEDLVLYITFDDTDEPEDMSPKESVIFSYAEPEELVRGVNGKAWSFDESTFILLTDQTFNDTIDQSSFSIWLKDPGDDGIIYEEGGLTHGYAVTMVDGDVNYSTRSNSALTTLVEEYPDDGRWHFIATVFDEGIMQLYIDGKLIDEESVAANIPSHSDEMGIGRINGDSPDATVALFTGIMDEFRITRRALTEEEVQEMYRKGAAVEPSGRSYTTWGGIRDIDL